MQQYLIKKVEEFIGENPDLVKKEIECASRTFIVFFCKSMIDESIFINGIIKPILEYGNSSKEEINLNVIKNNVLTTEVVENLTDITKICDAIKENKVLIFIDNNCEECLAVDIVKFPVRLPSEPPTSAVIKGPREGFVEDIKTNITLIRRRLMTENLVIKELKVGKQTQTKVVITYLKGIASKSVVNSIKNRIAKIDIDGIVDSSYLINFLEEKKYSIFKQVGSTEKPDVAVAKMLEGRVVVLVNNSPIALTLPFIYLEDIQSSNDYYSSNFYTSFIRIIRVFGIFMSIIVPGFYLSLRFYHYNLVPFKFLVTIANSTQTIPFTPFLELAFILILFQLLYEVSLRLPQYLGLATSIVGALILGDTGVKAGLISPPGVMIIALSIISIYTVPDQSDQLNLLRAIFLILGSGIGLVGIIAGVVFIFAYMNSLNNYGSPYLAPLSPLISSDLKDSFFKANISEMYKRPYSIKSENKVRLKK